MRITIIFSILIFASGCVGTLNLDDLSERLLSKLAYPAPDPQLKVLRSAHFARAIAWYGVRSVTKYSQGNDEIEKDAYSILKKMQDVQQRLNKLKKSKSISPVARYEYVNVVGELIAKAVKPTKRYYQNNIMARIADQNIMAAATTFLEAFSGLFEVQSRGEDFKKAIRAEYVGLFSGGKAVSEKQLNKNWKNIVSSLNKNSKDFGSAVKERQHGKGFLERKDIETIVNSLKNNEKPKDWLLDLAAIATTQKNPMSLTLNKSNFDAAWKGTTEKFNEYCCQLKKLAGDASQAFKCELGAKSTCK